MGFGQPWLGLEGGRELGQGLGGATQADEGRTPGVSHLGVSRAQLRRLVERALRLLDAAQLPKRASEGEVVLGVGAIQADGIGAMRGGASGFTGPQ